MTNVELNKVTFTLLGYAIFMWIYYKLAKKWIIKEKDKCILLVKAYISIMCAWLVAFFVLAVLDYLLLPSR